MTKEVYNKKDFYAMLWHTNQVSYFFERCLKPEYLEPIESLLLIRNELTPFSPELDIYKEARRCALEFGIYELQDGYNDGCKDAIDLVIDCYRLAARKGVTEAYNNIGVFLGMTNRQEEALPYWKKAALNGSSCGWINLLGHFGTKNKYGDMIYCLDRLIEMKHPLGYWNMALAHHFGYLGLSPDISKAKEIYEVMMTLVPQNKEEEAKEGADSVLLETKTMACYNLAQIRLLSEEHTIENLQDIIHLLTETPYVLLDQPRSNLLIKEIKQYL